MITQSVQQKIVCTLLQPTPSKSEGKSVVLLIAEHEDLTGRLKLDFLYVFMSRFFFTFYLLCRCLRVKVVHL